MTAFMRKFVLVLAFATVLPWPESCLAAGMNGWGARYAQVEQQRLADVAAREAQALTGEGGAEPADSPPAKEQSAVLDVVKVAATILLPGFGLILMLAD